MRETEQGSASHTPTRDSCEAPSASNRENRVELPLTKDIQATLCAEVGRLQTVAVTCRVLGKRPSRGELRDLIQASLKIQTGRISDIQFLGRDFYLLQFDSPDCVERLLTSNPLDVRGTRLLFLKWHPGFKPDEAARNMPRAFRITASFPGLLAEYFPLLEDMGALIGVVQPPKENMASKVSKAVGVPSVQILVSNVYNFPLVIRLPTLDGGFLDQDIVYGGLPGHCFICREAGHFAKVCPKKKQNIKNPLNSAIISNENIQARVSEEMGGWTKVGKFKNKPNIEQGVKCPTSNSFQILSDLRDQDGMTTHTHNRDLTLEGVKCGDEQISDHLPNKEVGAMELETTVIEELTHSGEHDKDIQLAQRNTTINFDGKSMVMEQDSYHFSSGSGSTK